MLKREGDGYGAYTDDVTETNGDKIFREHKSSASASKVSTQEAALRDALVEKLRESGMEVVTDSKEAQRVLDEENGRVRLNAKQKRALETASLSHREKDQPTVVSSALGAKIVNKLDILFNELEKISNYWFFYTVLPAFSAYWREI